MEYEYGESIGSEGQPNTYEKELEYHSDTLVNPNVTDKVTNIFNKTRLLTLTDVAIFNCIHQVYQARKDMKM